MRKPHRPFRAHGPAEGSQDPEHGFHTLRIWQGTVVGLNGDDVFVEFGPRRQGVVSVRQFEQAPQPGEQYDFTALGSEDGLWALARVEEGTLDSWSTMEQGSWVQARATGKNPGGLELKIGPLHAFMPKSETGLSRGQDPKVLIGKQFTCEVIEIDPERQRVFLSRKAVMRKQRESVHQRQVGALRPGQIVQGRVSRIESYGAFVRFGHGMEGLVHISNLSRERVSHPSEVVRKGQSIEVEVLTVRQSGKRIGLGLKQMTENPWKRLPRTHAADQVVIAEVTRVTGFGAFLAVAPGIEGLLHDSQSGLGPDRKLREFVKPGKPLAVRIVSFDVDAERMELSRLHRNGALVVEDDALAPEELLQLREEQEGVDDAPRAPGDETRLGRLLREALRGPAQDAAG